MFLSVPRWPRKIGADLVAMPVSKVGAPGREELAIGAVAPGGVKVLNHDVIAALRLSDERVEELVAKAAQRVERQMVLYNSGLQDGAVSAPADREFRCRGRRRLGHRSLHVGGTDRGPRATSRAIGPGRPGGAARTAGPVAPLVDEEICSVRPAHMQAVGAWYEDFSQTTDAEVGLPGRVL